MPSKTLRAHRILRTRRSIGFPLAMDLAAPTTTVGTWWHLRSVGTGTTEFPASCLAWHIVHAEDHVLYLARLTNLCTIAACWTVRLYLSRSSLWTGQFPSQFSNPGLRATITTTTHTHPLTHAYTHARTHTGTPSTDAWKGETHRQTCRWAPKQAQRCPTPERLCLHDRYVHDRGH
jgi:hypothetical protein